MPLPPETPRVPKVRVPAELFCKETPSVPPVTLVLPKLMLAVVVPMSMPCVVEPETVVEPVETHVTDEIVALGRRLTHADVELGRLRTVLLRLQARRRALRHVS